MAKKERIHAELDYDRGGKSVLNITNTNGAGLTIADIYNKMVEMYGGGVYAVIINTNSGELTDKVSSVQAYDVDDIPGIGY